MESFFNTRMSVESTLCVFCKCNACSFCTTISTNFNHLYMLTSRIKGYCAFNSSILFSQLVFSDKVPFHFVRCRLFEEEILSPMTVKSYLSCINLFPWIPFLQMTDRSKTNFNEMSKSLRLQLSSASKALLVLGKYYYRLCNYSIVIVMLLRCAYFM